MYGKRILPTLLLPICSATALEPNYTLPPITYMTDGLMRQEARQRGHKLMELKGVPDGDATLVCTNWICPTSIVVNATRYDVSTNLWNGRIEFAIATTDQPSVKIATGDVGMEDNGQEARLSAFVGASATSMPLYVYAQGVLVMPVDSATNMMFLTYADCTPDDRSQLIYKNIHIQYDVTSVAANSIATNALAFTAALINEGLPAEDRVPLPSAP